MADQTRIQPVIYRGVVVLAFGVILANLFYMQVVKRDEFRAQATGNVEVETRVRAPRGNILDRDGEVLADNVFRSSVVLRRGSLDAGEPDSTLSTLIAWYGLDRATTLSRLQRQLDAGRPQLTLVSDASMAQIALVRENARDLPGAAVDSRPWRRYPRGALFSHLIGYTGEVTAEEVERFREEDPEFPRYLSGDTIGREGLEATLEDTLRGRDGLHVREVDALGVEVGQSRLVSRELVPGRDVRLTVSAALQESLAVAMAGRPGCAVALDLPTGEILAAVSLPTYDANLFTRGISQEDWESLRSDPEHPLLNRLVQATYPPGSPYKIVTSLCALQEGAATTGTSLDPCFGGYQFGNRYFRCWKRTGHGYLNHAGALVHSCDVFYYQVVQSLDLESLRRTALVLGLGRRTGIPLRGEVAGIVPDSEWYDQRYGENRWTRGVFLNNAIGQGEILVTPLQMAVLTGRVALGDAALQPRLIRDEGPPRPPVPLPFRPSDLRWVRDTMHQVVDMGTGTRAQLEAVDVSGKTGTSQNPHGEDHAWFVCFAPSSQPQVAMAVILEHAGHGGAVAAPVAAAWLADYFEWRQGREALP